jgi:hypothetical protein
MLPAPPHSLETAGQATYRTTFEAAGADWHFRVLAQLLWKALLLALKIDDVFQSAGDCVGVADAWLAHSCVALSDATLPAAVVFSLATLRRCL